MTTLRLAWPWILRDWRGGEVGLLFAALALSAAAVATVDFFADRVQRALTGSAADLLAADEAIEWSETPRAEWEEAARAAGLVGVLVSLPGRWHRAVTAGNLGFETLRDLPEIRQVPGRGRRR